MIIEVERSPPLNIDQVVDAVNGFKGHVDAYAIAASLSIENQTHEQVAAKAIELLDRKPVVCSCGISSKAGIRERAATAEPVRTADRRPLARSAAGDGPRYA